MPKVNDLYDFLRNEQLSPDDPIAFNVWTETEVQLVAGSLGYCLDINEVEKILDLIQNNFRNGEPVTWEIVEEMILNEIKTTQA
jgi:hypothetical protein